MVFDKRFGAFGVNEDTKTLVSRNPMKYAKYGHLLQVISDVTFVTIGGYRDHYIPYCEKYQITSNEWRLLPSLNKARSLPGTAFLDNRFLYAIGGGIPRMK